MYMYSTKGGCLVSNKTDELVYVRINGVCGTSPASSCWGLCTARVAIWQLFIDREHHEILFTT